MMNRRSLTPLPPYNHRPREQRLIDHLRRHGVIVRAGWLVDARRGNVYSHPRVVETIERRS